jgi:taurine transport system permease protein
MTDMVVMGSVIIGLVSLFSDLLMRHLDHKLVPWKGKM